MNKTYLDTARMLVQVAPLVFFRDSPFALKGGTAINLFVQERERSWRCACNTTDLPRRAKISGSDQQSTHVGEHHETIAISAMRAEAEVTFGQRRNFLPLPGLAAVG